MKQPVGVILAGGRGLRMERPAKAVLRSSGNSPLERGARVMAKRYARPVFPGTAPPAPFTIRTRKDLDRVEVRP